MEPARLPPPGLPVDGSRLAASQVAARAAAAGTDPKTWSATRKAAESFEGQFMSEMLKHMQAGIETDGPFGGGHAEETFRSLLVDEYGKQVTRAGGLGLADAIQAQMLRMQEA
jgi:Rod binding domain-containing protein